MMKLYCVFLVGEPFLFRNETEREMYGFYRNEYVLATSSEKAVEVAKARTLKKLQRLQIVEVEKTPLSLNVENVKFGVPITWLFRNEGFLFFPIDPSER